MTGAELQALRRAAGINQTDMAAMINTTRHTISYWETKNELRLYAIRYGFPAKMLKAIGHPLPDYRTNTRARGWGLTVARAGTSGPRSLQRPRYRTGCTLQRHPPRDLCRPHPQGPAVPPEIRTGSQPLQVSRGQIDRPPHRCR
jgi:transcriptional regulator with XRE-family HTH domain